MAEEVRYVNQPTGEVFVIHGTLSGHGDNRDDGRDHWVDIDVFRTESGRYAIHRAGMSLVYHRKGNVTCTLGNGRPKGHKATRDDLPEGAVSCDVCEPPWPRELEPGEEVWYEWPRHSVKMVALPSDVAADLYSVRGRAGGRGVTAGKPARRALEACLANDEAFAAEVTMEVEFR